MSLSKSLTAVAVIGAAASAANAAIIPFWRVNPIPSSAIANSGGLLTANSISVSLMVELTGNSLFNVAGLDLTSNINGDPVLPGAVFFQRSGGGASNTQPPSQDDIDNSPGGVLAFDTYVCTADPALAAAVPGRLNGTGAGQIGSPTLQTTGANRTALDFNVAWGSLPNTGSPGIFEIARITFASGVFPGSTPIPFAKGRVSENTNPTQFVAFPPIPVAIPEPTVGFALAGLGLLAMRRK
ncbi:MAG: hypothetical protein RMJ35_04625 [Phycisphaerales bacterium]|nr:hypothetical protein [Phycisphaerales bacterium]